MLTRIRQRLGRVVEPQILFPVLGLIALTAIWGSTAFLIYVERSNARRAAFASTEDLLDTYHAQVVRAVREIDHALRVLQYAFELHGERGDFARLRELELLPPAFLFGVSIADREGNIVFSTRPLPETNVADHDYFLEQIQGDRLSVGLPRRDPESGEASLRFCRRLEDATAAFSGVAIVSVAADFFVSNYEPANLGDNGVLGIVGTDGVIRVRRTGDLVKYGEVIDYSTSIQGANEAGNRVALSVNPWDGVRRYTGTEELYGVPLSIVVGLSEAEQLAAASDDARVYGWRATAGSAILLLVLALFGRMAWQLTESQKQARAVELEHAKQVEHLAFHDGLTGLPNRSLFSKLVQQRIQLAQRSGQQFAVLFLDLDGFKHINDTLGHEAGDQILDEVAKRIKTSLRDSDTVARLGGDEFVILLPELTAEAYAATVARKILSSIARPFTLLGHEFRLTASVGIATHPKDGLDEDTLTKNADIAMYEAKEQGKNNYQFYAEELNTESLERLTLETSLRHGLEREEFELYYQAKSDLQTKHITGMEALLRWRHPDLGTIEPKQFITIAEHTRLILPIGKWVLETACRQNVEWQKAGLPRLSMAVNLSPVQFFDEHLSSDLASILEETGMDPCLLELEISEKLLMDDVERTLRILIGLKEMGVRVAVHDFGLGYTMLSSLHQFPLDTIKIDRTLIREVPQLTEDRALTEAIIMMGKLLSMTVVAQGVETQDQVDFLREHACGELQGFYLSRPVPALQFVEVLAAQSDPPGVA